MFDGVSLPAPERVVPPGRFARRVRSRIAIAAVASLLLHGAVLLSFLNWGGRERPPEPLPPPALDVEFMEAGNETGPTAPDIAENPSLEPMAEPAPESAEAPDIPATPQVTAPPPPPPAEMPGDPTPPEPAPQVAEAPAMAEPAPPPEPAAPPPTPEPPMPRVAPPPPAPPAPRLAAPPPAPAEDLPTVADAPVPLPPPVEAPPAMAEPAPAQPRPEQQATAPEMPPAPPEAPAEPAQEPRRETPPPTPRRAETVPPPPRPQREPPQRQAAAPRPPTPPQPRPQTPPRGSPFPNVLDLSNGPPLTLNTPPAPRPSTPSAPRRPGMDMTPGAPRAGDPRLEPMVQVSGVRDAASWLNLFRAWMERNKFYPRDAAQLGEQGVVRLRIIVEPDGRVRSVDVVRPSYSPFLNGGAVSLFRGRTLPAFPAGTTEPQATIDLTINYVLIGR